MMRHISLAASFLLACQAAPPPSAPPTPPEPPIEASRHAPAPKRPSALEQPSALERPSTPELDGPDVNPSAPLGEALQALAAHDRITSAKIGAGGVASETYAAYERVVAIATPDEERALVDHPDPVVRGYLGGHLARFHPGHLNELTAVLRDTTRVKEQQGCMRGQATVASYVAGRLCDAIHLKDPTADQARALLAQLADDATSPVQGEARRCLDSLPR